MNFRKLSILVVVSIGSSGYVRSHAEPHVEQKSISRLVKKVVFGFKKTRSSLSKEITQRWSKKLIRNGLEYVDLDFLKSRDAYLYAIQNLRHMSDEGVYLGGRTLSRTKQCLSEVLHAWRKEGDWILPVQPIDPKLVTTSKIRATKRHLQMLQLLDFAADWPKKIARTFGRAPLQRFDDFVEMGNFSSKVFRAKQGGRTVFLRVFEEGQEKLVTTARRTLMASELNEMLGLDTVVRSKVVKFVGPDGRVALGVLSEAAEGADLVKYGQETIGEAIAPMAFLSDAGNVQNGFDLLGFEFLIGQTDLHSKNVMFDGASRIAKSFDFDQAFDSVLPHKSLMNLLDRASMATGGMILDGGGLFLPENYTKHFVEQLKRLDVKQLSKRFKGLATPDELLGIIFRRDVLLQDITSRPWSVLP